MSELDPVQVQSPKSGQMAGTEAAKIESERLFAKVMDEVSTKSEERIIPKRAVDELGDENKSKLVHSAVGIVNAIREKAGLSRLADLPRARPGEAGSCVLARAFDQKASVGTGSITWGDDKLAEAASEVLGGGAPADEALGEGFTTRNPGTFQHIVNQFDNSGLTPYEANDAINVGDDYDAAQEVDTL